MDDEQKLTIAISAVDNASAVLKELAGNVTGATDEIKEGNEGANISFGTLVGGIVASQFAYQALMGALQTVKGFFESSITAALDASKSMVQVQVNVKNAGLSYEQVGPKIDALAKKNEALGFSNDETALSVSKAMLATGNYNDAIKLNQLAMDLSVAKNMDLNEATTLLNQVMAGNTRVLKQYGISLDSAATSADALNIVQGLVGGSAQALAGTPAGAIREMEAQWHGIEEEVGAKLLPVITHLFTEFEAHLPEIESYVVSFAEVLGWLGEKAFDVVGIISDGIGILVDSFMGMATTSMDTFNTIVHGGKAAADMLKGDFKDAASEMDKAKDSIKKGSDDAAFSQKMVADSTADLGKKFSDLVNVVGKADDSTSKLNKSTKDSSVNFDDFANKIQKADNAVLKHSDAVGKLSVDYNKMKDEGAKDLATLSDDFTSSMETINDAIAKTKASIADLTDSFNSTQKSDTQQVAESIVTSEQKIADIKAQMAKATTADEIANLQTQLDAEQKNYDSSLAFRTANVDAMTAAEARGKETDLQRTIDDYNAKAALDLKQYNQKLATLNQELKDKQKEAVDETNLYNAKVAQINKILDAGNAYFVKLSNDRLAQTTAEVNAEIAKFQALTAAINATKSASASAVSTISIPSVPTVAKHEAGGFVNAPRGTAVPIIAHGGEEIIPAEQAGRGGGNTTIIIQSPVVRRDSDLVDMRKMVEQVLRPLLINTKIIHI